MKFKRLLFLYAFVMLLITTVQTFGQTNTTVPVILTQPWTDTGIFLNQGQAVGIVVSGTMDYWSGPGGCSIPWPGYPGCIVTPAGIPWPGPCSGTITPGLACVSAVGMVGSGAPFEVGLGVAFTAQTSGELMLGVNDGYFADNTGSWIASISFGPGQLKITTTSLPNGAVGSGYTSGPLSAVGGQPFPRTDPYTWSAILLPPGLYISYFTGEVYAIPILAGSYSPAITVHDSAGNTSTKTFPVTIGPNPNPPKYTVVEKALFEQLYEHYLKVGQFYDAQAALCSALNPPFIGKLGVLCPAMKALALFYLDLADRYYLKVFDPADTNFTVIAQPSPPSLSLPDPDASWTAAQVAAYNDLKAVLLTEAQIIGLSEAEITCVNRAEGAYEAGSNYWQQQQLAALQRYNDLEAFDLQLLLVKAAELKSEYSSSSFPDVSVTVDQATQFELGIAQNGLPPDLVADLTALGFSPADLAAVRQAWSSFDPNTTSGDMLQDFIVPPSTIVTAIQQLIASFIRPFSSFAPKVEIGSTGSFELTAPITLNSNSDGIDPATDDVSFSLGSFAITIPAGSFTVNGKGFYQFTGTINGVALQAIIKPTTTGYQLQIDGSGVNLSNDANSMTVAAQVGNDGGTAMITAQIQ
jgi:hypothetical protein